MFCWKCGEVINDGEELCQVCGAERKSDTTEVADAAMKKAVGKVGEKIGEIGKEVVDSALKEVGKTMRKKAKKGTHKAMVKLGLQKETPLDKAEKIWKRIKK